MSGYAYSAPHESTSPQWARAWASGAGCGLVRTPRLEHGDVAMFGSPYNWNVLEQARAQGRTWFYGDHAYFGRRVYYRITRNAMQHDASGPGDAKRFEALGVRVKQWRRNGAYVLVCPNSPAYFERMHVDPVMWLQNVQSMLSQYTTRPMRVRWKSDPGSLEHELRNAWACVVFTSVSGVLAALDGVPCFATHPCASLSFGTDDLTRIENPVRPDNRFEMACALSSNQWTLHEIASGQAWDALR